jgi:hypothetical protein
MSHAESLIPTRGFDLGFPHGDNGNSVSPGIEDLQFIAGLLAGRCLIMLDHGGDIAFAEALRRNVFGKDDAAEEFVFHVPVGGRPQCLLIKPPKGGGEC